MSLYLVMRGDARIEAWSFSPQPPPRLADGVHFVNIASIYDVNHVAICLDVNTSNQCNDSFMSIAAATHELVKYSPELTAFLRSLPDFVTTCDFVSTYKSFEV